MTHQSSITEKLLQVDIAIVIAIAMFKMYNKKLFEVVFVSCVFSVVFGCFSIPLITFYATSDVVPEQEIGIDIDGCTQQVNRVKYQYEFICTIILVARLVIQL